jgi:hypothetical protein
MTIEDARDADLVTPPHRTGSGVASLAGTSHTRPPVGEQSGCVISHSMPVRAAVGRSSRTPIDRLTLLVWL